MAPGTESDQANGTDMIPAWVAFDKMVRTPLLIVLNTQPGIAVLWPVC
jgi:hypothetical protein